jgi:hypothetical protein
MIVCLCDVMRLDCSPCVKGGPYALQLHRWHMIVSAVIKTKVDVQPLVDKVASKLVP